MSTIPADYREILQSNDFEQKDFKIKQFTLDSNGDFPITADVLNYWEEYGLIFIKGFLPPDEHEKMKKVIEGHKGLAYIAWTHPDGSGSSSIKLAPWNNIDNGYTGLISRSKKMVDTWNALMKDECYHYHSKIVMKQKGEDGEGAFNWHQDYGYWYKNEFLTPNLGTTWIAIDRATRANGCLKMIPGSHKLGRIEHRDYGKQVGCEHERMSHVVKKFGFVFCELEPGDAVFFHSNIMHRSEKNLTDDRRWAFLVCYNAKGNDPVKKNTPANYKSPIDKVENSALKGEAKCPTDTDYLIESKIYL